MNIYEKKYERTHLNKVFHTTLNPEQPGVVRIHMIPPKFSLFRSRPSTVILNGKDIIPINASWAILLSIFIEEVNEYAGREITENDLLSIKSKTYNRMRKIYRDINGNIISKDLENMINVFVAIARREPTEIDVGQTTIADFAKFMKAPHRMDLMISSMKKNKHWNCNQKCLHCYAANQMYAETSELTTEEWKDVIDILKKNYVAQITFTGGEPTLRKDLVELVGYAKWFVTRVNTNGVLLTKELCEKLYEASLDSIQVTLYSHDEEIHNKLVGAKNFYKTVEGIRNAVEAGLNVSINTPLCKLNTDYAETLAFAKSLGVTYASCSGLIITGNAKKEESVATQLSEKEITEVLEKAAAFAKESGMEISFTSPGWIKEEKLRELNLDIPSCGACLSNMAICPDGNVVPCQSWLGENASLGNILTTKWKTIWNSKRCRDIRRNSCTSCGVCPLRGGKNDENK